MGKILLIIVMVMFLIDGISAVTTTTISNAANCTPYGDPPASLTNTLSGILLLLDICKDIPGHVVLLTFTDNDGEYRRACLLITASSQPLPLIVWLHGSLSAPSSVKYTDLVTEASTANLTGTKNGSLGYHLLLPYGRDTTHFDPPPDDKGAGWDNWYRNYNRSDPKMNVDAQTIDYFIREVKGRTDLKVDSTRVFMSGWSNGAAMALEYALNTLNIAAAAVYAAPDPYRDHNDSCAQTPYPPYFTPILDLHFQCDVNNNCVTAQAFFTDLNSRYTSKLIAEFVIVDSSLQPASTCD
jgi:predicted esterase